MHGERGAFDAGFFGIGGVEHLDGVFVLLGPADIHPHQHLGPVCGVHPTRAGPDGDQRLTLVVFPRQQGAHLGGLDVGAQRLELRVGLGDGIGGGRARFLGGQLVEHRQVVQAAP